MKTGYLPNDYSESDLQMKEMIDKARSENPSLFGDDIDIDIDYTFLNAPDIEAKKNTGFHRRRLGIAAAALVVLFLSGTFAFWLDSESAEAFRMQFNRFLHDVNGRIGFSDSETDFDIEEDSAIFTIYDMKDIGDAQRFLPELIIPHPEPEGYVLKNLVIQKGFTGLYNVDYEFVDKQDSLLKISYMKIDHKAESPSAGISQNVNATSIDIDGIQGFFWHNDISETIVLNYSYEENIFVVSGTETTIDDLANIARTMQ